MPLPGDARILLTGARGIIGSHVLSLLSSTSRRVLATDLHPHPSPASLPPNVEYLPADLTCLSAVDALFPSDAGARIGAVIHLGAIRAPGHGLDDRVVHNTNVVGSYNVLRTAAGAGVRRIAQASSVNAIGLSFSPREHRKRHRLPLTEESPIEPEDPYALSKAICEVQGASICRLFPGTRVASLRFHMTKLDYASAWPEVELDAFFGWGSLDAAAQACVLALDTDGWEGHEAFNIVAPEICWEGGASEAARRKAGDPEATERLGTVELVTAFHPEVTIDESWWEGNPRRGAWDTSKAERMLGWSHPRYEG
ncbi:hypothetical protein Q5752_000488 [Cryptotrichosporon argae]